MVFWEVGLTKISPIAAAGIVIGTGSRLGRVKDTKRFSTALQFDFCAPFVGRCCSNDSLVSSGVIDFQSSVDKILASARTAQVAAPIVQSVAVYVVNVLGAVWHELSMHLVLGAPLLTVGIPATNATPCGRPTVTKNIGGVFSINRRNATFGHDDRDRAVPVEDARTGYPPTGDGAIPMWPPGLVLGRPSELFSAAFAGKLVWHSGLLNRLVCWGRSLNLRPRILPKTQQLSRILTRGGTHA